MRTAKNHMTDGGDKWVVEGTLEIANDEAIKVGEYTLKQLLAGETDTTRAALMEKAMSGDLAFKCTPAALTTDITEQNIGTQQAIAATISGAVTATGAGNIDVTVVADGLDGGEKTVSVAVTNSDDDEAVALAIKTALAADADIGHSTTGMFTVTVSGAVVTITKKVEAANDINMDFSVETDTAVFEETTPLGFTLAGTQGVAPYTRDVLVQLVDSDDNVHKWFSGVVPVTIADNADGTASIETTNPVMENGEMTITISLAGVWAANKTNTLTVSQKTILGYTVAAKTSVETSE